MTNPTSPRVRNAETRNIKRKFLLPDELNWHTHSEHQKRALAAAFAEIGFVGHVLVRPAPGRKNRWIVIDGHERIEHFRPDDPVPCCVLDVTEAEARKLLLSYDPLGFLGGIDRQAVDRLAEHVALDSAELRKLVDDVIGDETAREPEPEELAEEEQAIEDAVDLAEGTENETAMGLRPEEHYDFIVVLCENVSEWNRLVRLLDLPDVIQIRTHRRIGLGRGVAASKVLELIDG